MPLLPHKLDALSARDAWRWWHVRTFTAPLVRALGFQTATRLAQRLASDIFDLRPAVRETVERNLRLADVARSDAEAAHLARGMFQHAARWWIELAFIPRCFRPRGVLRHVEWSQPDLWESLARSSQPLILLSPYLGNPVIGALALCERFGPLTIGIDQATRLLMDAVWPDAIRGDALRGSPDLRILTLPEESKRLAAVLEAGGRLCLLWGPRSGLTGLPATFLGRPCRFPATPLRLAARHEARLVVWTCRRSARPGEKFELTLSSEFDDVRRRMPGALTELLAIVESTIRADPVQYLWTR